MSEATIIPAADRSSDGERNALLAAYVCYAALLVGLGWWAARRVKVANP